MIYKKHIILFLTLFFFCPSAISADVRQLTLSSTDGLSNSSVNCIFQDSRMLMWMGTWDGLNVYNGYEFKTYKFEFGDKNTISNNVIRNILEDAAGNIWVSTDYGINRIDLDNGGINRFYLGYEDSNPTEEKAFSIATAMDGNIFCAATGWGVAYYDALHNVMRSLNIPQFNSSLVRSIFFADNSDFLLFTVDGALVRIEYSYTEFGVEMRAKTDLFAPGEISNVYADKSNIYAVSSDNKFYKYNELNSSFEFMGRLPVSDSVQDVTQSDDNTVLIAYNVSGIFSFDIENKVFRRLPYKDENTILSLYYGSQDILWIGSDGQGVIEVFSEDIGFEKMMNSQMFSTKSCPVRSFFQDSKNNMYIGTKGNGIYVIHSNDEKGSIIDMSDGLSNNNVYSMKQGNGNDIFIGHDGEGIDVYSISNGSISHINPINGEKYGSVYAIYRDIPNNRIWLGTNGYGLIGLQLHYSYNKYTVISQAVYEYDKDDPSSLNNNSIFSIVPAPKGCLWLGTRGGGLNLFNPATGRFRSITTTTGKNSISNNDILSLHLSSDSTLWIGTSYGLNSISAEDIASEKYQFRQYLEKDGLPNNTIHGILEDNLGNIWVSTNFGISKLNPNDGKIVSFYNNDALQSNEFSDCAYYQYSGKMYFGGVNGFNNFYPENVHARNYQPKILIDNIRLQNKDISDYGIRDTIVLEYKENFFSIGFHAQEYIRNSNCEYRYILKGFNEGWIDSGTNNIATFTNVPSGTYTFCVRSTNGDKMWSEKEATLMLIIKQPWWNLWWAWLGYSIIALFLFYCSYLLILSRQKQKKMLEIESIKKVQQEENYEAKMRFFTNIAHEFCTPITLIYGSGELLLNNHNLPPSIEKYVRMVKNNANRMQRLIEELLEFRKVDIGHYEPKYTLVNLNELLLSIIDDFNDLNEQRNIKLKVSLSDGETDIVVDRNAIEKIFYNLISNAYKYTPVGGYIEVNLSIENDETKFSVTNSGKGIKAEELHRVFNRFEILDNLERRANEGKQMRNGIGLALSQSLANAMKGKIDVFSIPDDHTVFTLSLPKIDDVSVAYSFDTNEEQAEITEHQVDNIDVDTKSNKQIVLVVDDERQIREFISEIIGTQYEVLLASDGLKAIEVLKRQLPDLILSDIIMPNLDGYGLLQYVKGNDISKHIPFVFLTSKAGEQHEIDGYEMGGEGYISKPFNPSHLKAIVAQILNNRVVLKNYYNSAVSSTDIYQGSIVNVDDKSFVMKLTKMIEDNITDENLSIEYLCDKMMVSRITLYRKIKEITQSTPSEFIRLVKIKHATKLLKQTNMTIQEIMFCSGFNNKSYFYREFARIYNMSPKEYREKE